MIVGICGKKGSGKTTAAEVFMKAGYKSLAFADTLKQATSKVFDIPLSILNDAVAKDSMQISINLDKPYLKAFLEYLSSNFKSISPELISRAVETYRGPDLMQTPRQLLQVLGTDLIRTHISDQYWIEALESLIKPGSNYVIHDVRFQNEADLIRNKLLGKVLIVERPRVDQADYHVSELFMPAEYDYKLLNYSNLAQFTADVKNTISLIGYQDGKKE